MNLSTYAGGNPLSANRILGNQPRLRILKYLNFRVLMLFAFHLGGFVGLNAQSYREWQGSGNGWNTAGNWTSGGIVNNAQLEWKGNGLVSSINDYANPYPGWRLYFTGSKAYTLSGSGVNLFDFGGAFTWVLNDASVDQNINFDLNFADLGARYAYITNRSTGGLTFGSGKNVGVTGGSITALRISGTNTTGGITFNGTLSGSRPVDIGIDNNPTNQTNTRVFLNGVNSSYTGITTMYAGTLTIPANSALGSGNLIMGNGGAAVTNTLAVTGTTTRTQPISIVGTSQASVIDVASGQEFTLSGAGTLPDNSGSNTTKFGKSGAGTLTVTGANTYKGQVHIGEGTVIVQNNTALGNNGNASNRGIYLGEDVGGTAQANNVSLLATNGVVNNQTMTIAANTSGATRTLGVSGAGSAEFANTIILNGTVSLNGGSGTLTLSGNISEATAGSGVTVTGGTATLTAGNTYTGKTKVNSGATLKLGGDNKIDNSSGLELEGGTLNTNSNFDETFGTLTINGSTPSTIQMVAGVGNKLNFANSSGVTWGTNASLVIKNWDGVGGGAQAAGTPRIFVGTTSAALTSAQLQKISFEGYLGTPILLSNGELVPPGPILTVSGTPIAFGNVCVGGSSFVDYTITNTGGTASGITVTSNNARYVVSNISNTTITGGGGTATFRVTFSPNAVGAQNATITVATTTSYPTYTQLGGLTGSGVAAPVGPVIAKNPNVATVCAGQVLTVSVTAGTGGAGVSQDEYRSSTDNGANWSAWSTSVPSFAAVVGTNLIESRRTSTGSGCTTAPGNSVSWTVVALPVAPGLTKSPNVATVCAGQVLTVSVSAGTGGTGTSQDEYRSSTDNGANWSAWGTSVPSFAAVVGTNLIESRRTSTGTGCTTSSSNSVSWTVVAQPVAPGITKSPNVATVCAGQVLTVSVSAGTGGTGTSQDEYRSSTDNGANWSAWGTSVPSFAAVVGTNLIESRRTSTGTGCTTSSSNQVSWTVVAQPVAPGITKSPNVATVCAGQVLTVSVSAGTGGTGTSQDEYRTSTDNGANWSAWGTSVPSFAAVVGTNIIESRRTSTGTGCTTSSSNSVSWTVVAQPVAPGITKSPNVASVCVGTTLTVSVSAGTGGTGTSQDEYRSSTDNGANWSAWGTSVPSFAAVVGTNIIESRRTSTGTGCTTSSSNSVSWTVEALPATPTLTVTQITPCVGTTGSIFVSAPTGAGMTYSINGGPDQSSQTFGSLTPGNYTITAKSALGCVSLVAANATINPAISCLTGGITGAETILCYSDFTVLLTASASGGTAPYTYLWNTGKSGSVLTGAGAGTYTCTITDGSGQSIMVNHTITGPTPVTGTVVVSPYKCLDPNKGSIVVNATGGTPGYNYALNFGTWQVSNSFSGLDLGKYKVNIRDANGCQGVLNTIMISSGGNVKLTAVLTPVSTCAGSNGSITATATNGTAPYQYRLGAGPWQGTGTFTGLAAGNYTINVKDAIGCTQTRTVTIIDNGKDAFESNNTAGAAKSINLATPIVARIGTATDQDWFKFNTGVLTNFDLTLTHGSVTYTFKLFANDGVNEIIPSSSGPGIKSYTGLSLNTTYRIQVTGAQSFECYNLAIVPASIPPPTEMLTSKQVEQPGKELSAMVFPNPHDGNFILQVNSPVTGKGSVVLYDLQGRAITEREENLKAGTNQVRFNNLQKMNYIYRVTIGGQQTTGKAFGF